MNMSKIIQKRAISLVLAIMIVVSCTFNTAMADTTPAADSVEQDSAASMSLLGVVNPAPTPAVITWSRSMETSEVKKNVANTNWTWSVANTVNHTQTSPTQIWNANSNTSATWNYQTQSGGNSKMDLRRFQGTFTIPAGFQRTDTVRYSSVNQSNYTAFNNGNVVPINDDIFIFCYKRGTVLTDDNYLDYLAFWSGTSGPRDGPNYLYQTALENAGTTFHGRVGMTAHNSNESKTAMPSTDGWYVNADLDNIGAALFRTGTPAAGEEYVIDIFTQEYAGGGGMDEPQITFTHSNDYRVQAQNDYYQTTSGTPANLDILKNDKVYLANDDVTANAALQVNVNSLVSSTEGITLRNDGGGHYTVLQGATNIGSLTVGTDGTGTFIPAAGYSGNLQFKYTAACTPNSNTYTADAYVTISVKNLDLNKTAQYTGDFDSTTGAGRRTYQLSLSASVHSIGDTYEPCVKPYSTLPDGIYYTDSAGTTAVTKRTQPAATTYNWFKDDTPISLTNLYTRTAGLPTITYQKVAYSTVSSGGDSTASYSILLKDGTRIPLTYYNSGQSPYSDTYYSAWESGGKYYYYDEDEYIWQYDTDNYHDSKIVNHAQFQKMITTPSYQYNSINIATTPVSGTDYFIQHPGGGYDRVTWSVAPETTSTAWYNASSVVIPEPATLYRAVATNAAIDGATVQDTIDPRFVVLNGGTEVTDKINPTTLANGGVVSYDNVAQVWKVVWRGQTIPVTGQWSNTIQVMAKSEFFGGNDIITNVRADSYVSFVNANGDNVKMLFRQPTVNVPIYLPQANQSKTIFLGEEVGTLPANISVDVAAFNNPNSPMWCGKGQTGTISAKWYYDENCTNPADGVDPAAIAALTPSDTTPFYYKVTYTPAGTGAASAGPAIPTTSVTSVYTVNVIKGQLTITKTVTGTAAPNQFFTFKVERYAKTDTARTGTVLSTSYEVIHGAGSKVIINLPQGNYKVTEISGSAWRYKQQGVTQYSAGQYLGRNAGTPTTFTESTTATITNQLTNNKWISGQDSVTNVFVASPPTE